jgi:hypothetical protein
VAGLELLLEHRVVLRRELVADLGVVRVDVEAARRARRALERLGVQAEALRACGASARVRGAQRGAARRTVQMVSSSGL